MKNKKYKSYILKLKNKKICFLFSLSLAAILVAIIEYILSEILVILYMQTYGLMYRSDLANDYGLGFLGLALSVAVFILGFPILFFIFWKVLRKNNT